MEEERKLPIIVVPFGSKSKISNRLNVSRDFVGKALSYSSNTKMARKVRSIALNEYGGIETTKTVKS